jgi:hypothetical protein
MTTGEDAAAGGVAADVDDMQAYGPVPVTLVRIVECVQALQCTVNVPRVRAWT